MEQEEKAAYNKNPMKKLLPYLIAFITGGVISIMVIFNTEFGRLTSSEVSLTINQITGIVTLTLIMLCFPKSGLVNPKIKKAPWYLFFGGLFGVLIISANYIGVTKTGATIAMAGAVFGQSLTGLVMDLTGLMGVKKQQIGIRRWIGLAICLIGIAIMFVKGGSANPLYILPSIGAGILTMIQMVYNSRLSSYKGPFRAARVNVISGLFGALAYSFIFYPETTIEGFSRLSSVPFFLMVAGGLTACIVVVNTNIVIPKIPAVYSALLLSSGQITVAVFLDLMLYSIFTPALLAGAAVIIIGIAAGMERTQSIGSSS